MRLGAFGYIALASKASVDEGCCAETKKCLLFIEPPNRLL